MYVDSNVEKSHQIKGTVRECVKKFRIVSRENFKKREEL